MAMTVWPSGAIVHAQAVNLCIEELQDGASVAGFQSPPGKRILCIDECMDFEPWDVLCRYFDPETVGLDFDGMAKDLQAAPEGSIIVLHGEMHVYPQAMRTCFAALLPCADMTSCMPAT